MFRLVLGVASLVLVVVSARADVFNMPSGQTGLQFVSVGDPGNAADTTGYGSVSYTYQMGKYEVTAGQYTEFLNAKAKTDPYGLYNSGMSNTSSGSGIAQSGSPGNYTYSVASDFASRPVNLVSYWDACRFANWLCNGQGNGNTETGAYTLNGYNGDDGRTITRNTGAKWFLPSEQEWCKAAYYKGGGTNAGYWDYPTSSDTVPGRDMADVSGNNANYYGSPFPIDSGIYYTTVVGEFQNSDSPYGTFDQGGNVFEWNEAVVYGGNGYSSRGLRGGGRGCPSNDLAASYRYDNYPTSEYTDWGFRVASIPEPSSLALVVVGGLGLLGYAWRRRK